MKQIIMVFAIIFLVGGATWYGLSQSRTNSENSPEVAERLNLANRFINDGDATRAMQVLDELLAQGVQFGERGDYLKVLALESVGRFQEASQAAENFLASYNDSRHRTEVELTRLTAELENSGLANPSLREQVEGFLQRNPKFDGAATLHVSLARQDRNRGDLTAAQRRLLNALDSSSPEHPGTRAVKDLLGEINLELIKSPALLDGDKTYTVKSGDVIANIARAHGITQELLMRANNITDPRRLRVGQELKIPNVNFTLVCDVAANTLTLYNHGQFFKIYDVRTGRRAGSTPTGEFRILNKKTDPTWRPGDGRVYHPGDPNNELGTRWMAFQGDLYGIHGTTDPSTVGHYASNGCIGMRTSEVEELFDLITVGTSLTVKGDQDITRHKVIPARDIPPPINMAGR